MEPGITIATEEGIAELVRSATRELVVLAPALTERVAEAVADRWRHLGRNAVQVILDSDPEVYRLGFGDERGLDILDAVAGELKAPLRRQPGTRIVVVVADGRTLVYAPSSQLIDAGPNTAGAANAIFLGMSPAPLLADLGNGDGPTKVGRSILTGSDATSIKQNLKDNPPQKFDIARRMHVFNAYVEFVELEMAGVHVDRKRIQIPTHLMGVADQRTREQISSHFRLVAEASELSGEELRHDRELIARRFLRVIPNYGTVVKRSEKAAFEEAVGSLRKNVEAFREKLEAKFQASIDRSRKELTNALLPGVTKNPPKEWWFSDGRKPDRESCRIYLERDLAKAFGSAGRLISEMSVNVRFKGVTYELLRDEGFLKAASKAGIGLEKLHEEFAVAKAVQSHAARAAD